MWLRRGVGGLVVLVGLGGGVDVAAQEGGGGEGVTVLTLRDALALATRFNSDYRQALRQLELDSHPRRQWWAEFLPTVNLSYNTGLDRYLSTSWFNPDGTPERREEPTTITRSQSSHNARLSFSLLDGGQRFYQLGQTRAEVRRSRVTAEQRLNATLAEVQRRYLTAQQQQAKLAIEEALLADRQLEFGENRRRFELLAISRSVLLGAELDLENQQISVRTARGELDKALLALRTAIGDAELGAVQIDQQPPAPFDPATLDLAELVARAGRGSLTVASAEADVAVQRATLNASKAVRWPSITLSTNFGGSGNSVDYNELFGLDFNDSGFSSSADLSFNIPIADVLPIFDGYQKSYSVASATMALRNAEMSFQQTMLQIEESIRSKYLDLQTAWDNVLQRQRAREVASERLAIVREEYLLATSGIEELRAAIRDEATARRDEVDQRFTFATALLTLYEELGIVAQEAGIDLPTEGN